MNALILSALILGAPPQSYPSDCHRGIAALAVDAAIAGLKSTQGVVDHARPFVQFAPQSLTTPVMPAPFAAGAITQPTSSKATGRSPARTFIGVRTTAPFGITSGGCSTGNCPNR